MSDRAPSNDFERYHAHVYFTEHQSELAREVCMGAWQACHVGLGRLHQKPVGPHPLPSCQLSFDSDEFERIIGWLQAHRGELNVLVHPLTGDALAEHTTHARWLGASVTLRTEIFES